MRARAALILLVLVLFSGQVAAPNATLTPNSAPPGTTLDVVLSVVLNAGGQVRFEPPGLIAANLRNDPRRQLQFTLQIPPNARPGVYDLIYLGPQSPTGAPPEQMRVPRAFTVTAPPRAPEPARPAQPAPLLVRSIDPGEGKAGAPPFTVVVQGTGFANGARLDIAGVQVLSASVERDGTRLVAQVSIPPNADAAMSPVIVKNPDGNSNRRQQPEVKFRVHAGPTPAVRRIDPSSATAGQQNIPVVITGINFAAGAKVSVADGSVLFGAANVIGDSQINATISIPATAGAGPRTILVTNPDGRSNRAQSPPVVLNIMPAPPPVQQPAPPIGLPPPPPPTSTQPPPSAPPPTSTQPPVSLPPPPPPVSVPPVAQPPATPPPTRPAPITPPPITPPSRTLPTERLKGPRIDLVTPQKFAPGATEDVQLLGINLTADIKLSFGRGIVITKLRVTSPTTALATISVSPAVKVGAYAAQVTSSEGSANGPGGILVAATVQPQTAVTLPPDGPQLPEFDQPYGDIELDQPCDINSAMLLEMGGRPTCTDVPPLTDELSFFWHELNPGIAKFFVFEIVDYDGEVLFSAQTKQTWYRLTASNLASLPRMDAPAVSAGNVANVSGPASGPGAKSRAGAKPKSGSGAVNVSGTTGALNNSAAAAQTQYTIPPVALSPNLIKDGPTRSKKAGHHPLTGEVFWRVRGMSNKLHEVLGTPLPEMIESERSVERPILLPIPPNGFSCSNGTPNTKISFLPRYQPQIPPPLMGQAAATKPLRPKPCEGESTNICSPVDLVEFTENSQINLSRIPFDLQQTGSFGGPWVRFNNVWIDWGDGSEPEPLVVKGDVPNVKQSLKNVRFFRPGNEGRRIAHRYLNEDKKAVLVKYTVRIYALADADATPPAQWAESSAAEAQSAGSLVNAVHGGTPSNASNAPASAANATNTSAGPHSAAAATAAANGVFTIACEKVEVRNVWEAGYDDPLHLLTAKVLFSTEMQPATKGKETSAKSAYKGPAPGSADRKNVSSKDETAAAATAKTYVPGSDPTIPEVSDCSTVFKAAARITYYGHGKLALDWYLDDVFHIETTVVTSELPRVSLADGEAEIAPVVIWMKSALPPALSIAPHRVRVVARVVIAGKGKAKPPSSQYAPGATKESPKKKSQLAGATSGPSGQATVDDSPADEPWRTAESETRKYHVFNHKTLGLPCTLRYATAESGAFEITDITSFERSAQQESATFSGNGFLNVTLPSPNGSSTAASQGIPIAFKDWRLEPAEDDFFDVKEGQYQKTLNYPLDALTFPFRITKLNMSLQRVTLNGNVAADEGKGFTTAGKQPVVWEFGDVPITADGGFYYESPKKVEALLGASGFSIDIANAAIDFSLSKGAAPEKTCTTTPAGEKWQGIAIDGTLVPPATVALNNVPLLKDYKFEKWGITPSGLSVSFNDDKHLVSLSQSGVKVTVRGLKFSFCGGKLGTTEFGLDIENAPLIVKKLSGKLTMDDQAQLLPDFTLSQPIEHDWGNVRAKITDAQFVLNPHASAYGLSLKSHVWFEALNKPAYDHAYDGLFISLAGNIANAENKHYWGVPGAGVADMGGFPMTVTQLGVGNEPNGDLWFGFTGDIEAGDNAPQAPNKEAKFVLKKESVSASLLMREPWQLASLDWIAADEATLDDGYTAGDESLQVESFTLNWSFPPGSGTVELVAECTWASGANRYFMHGKGEVIVLDSFTAGAEVLFGQDSGQSYWVIKGHYALPTMIPLGSTPFGLARFDGGLSYNVGIEAFDANDLKTVQKDGQKAIGVYGAVDVGTKADNGYMLYGRGGVTIRIADDWGLRMSIKVWLVTSDHESLPSGEACVQYAGGAFDAGATAHIKVAGDILVIEAPQSGGDVCTQAAIHAHFGGGDDWFINVGTETSKLSVYFLFTTAEGYMTMNPSGVVAYAGVHVEKKWGFSSSICDGYVGINAGLGAEGKLQASPFYIQATVSGHASLYARACGVGTGFGASVSFTGGAPPLSLCGKVKVKVDLVLDDISMSISRCL